MPPARYTEPTLINGLEERGICRPSAYKTIFTKLRERFVWSKKGNPALIPTVMGFATYRLFRVGFEPIVEYGFTKDLEARLDDVAAQSQPLLHDFYFGTEQGTGLHELVQQVHGSVDSRDLWALDLSDVGRALIGEIEGLPVFVKTTPTGSYFQLGDKDTRPKKTRPRTVGLLSTMDSGEVTVEDACTLLRSPKKSVRTRRRPR